MGFLDSLLGFFGGLGSVVAQIFSVLVFLFQLIFNVAIFLFKLLQSVFLYLFNVVLSVGKFFQHLWDNFFKGVFTKVLSAIRRAHDWIETRLGPLLKHLQAIRAYLDKLFRTYVKPILNTIQHVRQVLLVLRLLHVKFAAELDRKLAVIEGKIVKTFAQIRAPLNLAIGLLNNLATPSRLVRFVLTGIVGSRASAAIVKLVTGANIGWFYPNFHPNAKPWEKPVLKARDLKSGNVNPSASSLLASLLDADTYTYTEDQPAPNDQQIDSLEPTFTFSVTVQEYVDGELAMDALSPCPVDVLAALTTNSGCLADSANGGVALFKKLVAAAA